MTMIASVLFLLAVGKLFSANPGALVLLLPFVVIHFSVMVSLVAIESGHPDEGDERDWPCIDCRSLVHRLFAALSGDGCACHRCAGNAAALKASRPARAARPRRLSVLSAAGLAIGAFAVIYLGLAGMRTGFPLLMGADRYLFRASRASIVTLNLLILKYLLAAVLGTGAAFAKSRAGEICTTPRSPH